MVRYSSKAYGPTTLMLPNNRLKPFASLTGSG